MFPEPDRIRFQHVLDAAREAMGFAQGHSCEDLTTNRMLLGALLYCLAVNRGGRGSNRPGEPRKRRGNPLDEDRGYAKPAGACLLRCG